MQTYDVKLDPRYEKRKLYERLGNNILNYITELITNSDDSYRKLEDKNILNLNEPKPIYIIVEKGNRKNDTNDVITIIDNAEGMDEDILYKKFANYGSHHEDGNENKARGIFGQGASDVLQSAAVNNKTSQIISFKNGHIYRLQYNVSDEGKKQISINELTIRKNQIDDLRNKYKVPNNGTVVSFGIPENVKYNNKLKKNLKFLIESYPSLKYILSDDKRRVYLKTDGEEFILTSKKYAFIDKEVIFNKDFEYCYETDTLKCRLILYKNEIKEEDGTQIIVRDENYVVYDNTMFDFENSSLAHNISGELIIEKFYGLVEKNLNKKEPIALVNDNRTGLDTKKDFYKGLNKRLFPILKEALNSANPNERAISLTNDKKFFNALKSLNKYISNEIQESIGGPSQGNTPPSEGIKFARSSITITEGKTYNLKLYINSDMVSISDKINISVESNDSINVNPLTIDYVLEEVNENGLITKSISIQSFKKTNEPIVIKAQTNLYLTSVIVNVIKDEIHYPENGFEIYPKEVLLNYNVTHCMNLYIDTNIIPIGSEIYFETADIKLQKKKIILENKHQIFNSSIAKIEILSNGGIPGNDYLITAVCNDYETSGKITLCEPKENKNIGGGLISDIKIDVTANAQIKAQSWYMPKTHILYIQPNNVINKIILGDLADIDPDKPKFNKEQKKYVCDIIATQVAYLILARKKGEINLNDAENALSSIMNLIQEQKNKIFNIFYRALYSDNEENSNSAK